MSSAPSDPVVRAALDHARATLPALLDRSPATSSLAPFLLAALLAPVTRGEERTRIEQVLGLDADAARAAARRLVEDGPGVLRSAVALWHLADIDPLSELAMPDGRLPAGVTLGAVPDQATADAWTRARTLGLIERFPIDIRPEETVALLAAAIATKVGWDRPMAVVSAPENRWGVRRMLRTFTPRVVSSPVGLIGTTVARGADGIAVHSFIAEPGVDRAALVRAALDLAEAHPGDHGDPLPAIPHDTLPANGHAWTVHRSSDGNGRTTHPAFEERADGIDVLAVPGVPEGAAAFRRMVAEAAGRDVSLIDVRAAMSAIARYDRRGFEAAAIMAMDAGLTGPPPWHRPPPAAWFLDLRFDRPHLVLAVATDPAWRGLPLFAAWVDAGVHEPEEDIVETGAADPGT